MYIILFSLYNVKWTVKWIHRKAWNRVAILLESRLVLNNVKM